MILTIFVLGQKKWYSDDTVLLCSNTDISKYKENFELHFGRCIQYFNSHHLHPNTYKIEFIVCGKTPDETAIKVGHQYIKSKIVVKHFGFRINTKLKYQRQVKKTDKIVRGHQMHIRAVKYRTSVL